MAPEKAGDEDADDKNDDILAEHDQRIARDAAAGFPMLPGLLFAYRFHSDLM